MQVLECLAHVVKRTSEVRDVPGPNAWKHSSESRAIPLLFVSLIAPSSREQIRQADILLPLILKAFFIYLITKFYDSLKK